LITWASLDNVVVRMPGALSLSSNHPICLDIMFL
jgi:hypothetical protein